MVARPSGHVGHLGPRSRDGPAPAVNLYVADGDTVAIVFQPVQAGGSSSGSTDGAAAKLGGEVWFAPDGSKLYVGAAPSRTSKKKSCGLRPIIASATRCT